MQVFLSVDRLAQEQADAIPPSIVESMHSSDRGSLARLDEDFMDAVGPLFLSHVLRLMCASCVHCKLACCLA